MKSPSTFVLQEYAHYAVFPGSEKIKKKRGEIRIVL